MQCVCAQEYLSIWDPCGNSQAHYTVMKPQRLSTAPRTYLPPFALRITCAGELAHGVNMITNKLRDLSFIYGIHRVEWENQLLSIVL